MNASIGLPRRRDGRQDVLVIFLGLIWLLPTMKALDLGVYLVSVESLIFGVRGLVIRFGVLLGLDFTISNAIVAVALWPGDLSIMIDQLRLILLLSIDL